MSDTTGPEQEIEVPRERNSALTSAILRISTSFDVAFALAQEELWGVRSQADH